MAILPVNEMAPDRKNEDVEKAVARVEPGRLLDGEDPDTRYADDAAHWVNVYTELLLFKQRLIGAGEQALREMSEVSARKEAAGIDLDVLRTERDRLQARVDFWKERRRELSPGE